MAISVRLDPALEAAMEAEAEARRLGITKTALVKDSLERRLGLKNPAELLRAVRSDTPMGNPRASEQVSARMKAKLRAQRGCRRLYSLPATRQTVLQYFVVAKNKSSQAILA